MTINSRPQIFAVAAVSGGWKTTITSRLNQELNNSRAIYFDEYDLEGPEDIIDWVERGANLIIDGSLTVDEIIRVIMSEINK